MENTASLLHSLPPELAPFREKWLATLQPYIRVRANPERPTSRWESKVGGLPYWPKEAPYPTAADGRPLFFLAQLNFADMPALKPFPTSGIVQFYIYDDELYGMDFDNGENQANFRILYFSAPLLDEKDLQTTLPLPADYDLLPHHPEHSYPLTFETVVEVAPITDYRFWQHFGADFFLQFGEREWELQDAAGRAVRSDGHKVGGYAYFTQDDPRRSDDPMLLLFQLDSDEDMDLMWGDIGVGHFFIREQDLIARRFDRVLYDWDCL